MPAAVAKSSRIKPLKIEDVAACDVTIAGKTVHLTNLQKVYWPEEKFTKGDLVRYYAAIAPYLLPHIQNRAMVMKRYVHGATGPFFFMKRAPVPRPEWIKICKIEHDSGNIIDFPVVDDLPTLLWLINLGCIDLNQWYGRCDEIDRPDYLHFDLDPVSPKKGQPDVPFERVIESALVVRDALARLDMPAYAKTTGSRGIHVYIPIVRGPTQKEVWTFAKKLAFALAQQNPELLTSEYRIAKRPQGRVLVDYNQNAWGRTLASIYSVRPKKGAPVSMPVTWKEIESGKLTIEQFNIRNAVARVKKLGDLWKPVLHTQSKGRVKLEDYLNV